jgi:hypothetical protein
MVQNSNELDYFEENYTPFVPIHKTSFIKAWKLRKIVFASKTILTTI